MKKYILILVFIFHILPNYTFSATKQKIAVMNFEEYGTKEDFGKIVS